MLSPRCNNNFLKLDSSIPRQDWRVLLTPQVVIQFHLFENFNRNQENELLRQKKRLNLNINST